MVPTISINIDDPEKLNTGMFHNLMKNGKLDLDKLKKYFIPVLKLQQIKNGKTKYYVN